MEYDLVIVGAGPAGLALAQRATAPRVLIIDEHTTIGGCHRVERVTDAGIFTEHGPRVYSTAYLTFRKLLKEAGLDFNKLFTPYKFNIGSIGGQTIFRRLSARELAWLAVEFGRLMVDPSHGTRTAMADFMRARDFRPASVEVVDRLCRLTDGGGADRFSLNEFLELFNQQLFYRLYQPRAPNDVGLFPLWRRALERTGRVRFMLGARADRLVAGPAGVESLVVSAAGAETAVRGKAFVLAIPPVQIAALLGASRGLQDSFGPFDQLSRFAETTKYDVYVSLTLNWRARAVVPRVYGFPWSDWGVIFVNLTDYMSMGEYGSVLSVAVTLIDAPSRRTGKTANACPPDELIEEVLHQLAYLGIPRPDLCAISPGNTHDGQRWRSADSAYISTGGLGGLPQAGATANLFNVGSHNKLGAYKFTTMETAVQNSCALASRLYPGAAAAVPPQVFTVRLAIILVLLLIIILACAPTVARALRGRAAKPQKHKFFGNWLDI